MGPDFTMNPILPMFTISVIKGKKQKQHDVMSTKRELANFGTVLLLANSLTLSNVPRI